MVNIDPNPAITAYKARRAKKLNRTKRKIIFSFSVFLALTLGLLVSLVAIRLNTEYRHRAATGNITTVRINTPSNVTPGSSVLIPIELQTNIPIQGFELHLSLNGTIPPDLNFTVNPELDFKDNFVNYLDTSTSPGTFSLGAIFLPGTYTTNNQCVTLGTLTFTAPNSGHFTLSTNDQNSSYVDPNNPTTLQPLNPPVGSKQITFNPPPSPTTAPPTNPPPSSTSAPPTSLPSSPTTDNLLSNPSFETDPYTDYFTHGEATYTHATDAAHSGSKSLKIVSTQTGLTRWLSRTNQISATPGQTYYASVWVKTQNATKAYLHLNFWSGTGPNDYLLNSSSSAISGTNDWTKLSLQATAPPQTQLIRVEMRQEGPGEVWFDDIHLSITPPASTPPPQTSTSQISSFTLRANIFGISPETTSIQIPITVQIGLVDQSDPIFSKTVPFSFSANSTNPSYHFTGLSYPQLTTNNHYWISLKGEKHTQRVFADISLSQDAQIDLTSNPLEPGDLPPQDGKVDQNDINKLLNIFSKTNPTANDLVADLNYDGIINSVDLGLILKTISTKPDELPN